jgi:hypothetical protein
MNKLDIALLSENLEYSETGKRLMYLNVKQKEPEEKVKIREWA